MSNVSISLTRDTSQPATRLGAYDLAIWPTGETPTATLQSGAVVNNLLTYRGVFETIEQAAETAVRYVGNCQCVETVDPASGERRHRLEPISRRTRYPAGYSWRLLARQTPSGTWVGSPSHGARMLHSRYALSAVGVGILIKRPFADTCEHCKPQYPPLAARPPLR